MTGMILKRLEIEADEEDSSYTGVVEIISGDKLVIVSFGTDDVRKIMQALKYELPSVVRISPDYSTDFMPTIEVSEDE